MQVSTIWQIEASTYLLILAVFIGAAYTQKHEGHISIDLVTVLMPAKARDIIGIVGAVLGFIVALVIARYSWPVWWEAIEFDQHSESLWGPHLGFPYILIPLGMTLLALQYVVYIVRKITLFRAKHSAVVVPEKSETAENAGAEA
jgi:TRAP-type C4-dicarboxylate transport system permease small subunit